MQHEHATETYNMVMKPEHKHGHEPATCNMNHEHKHVSVPVGKYPVLVLSCPPRPQSKKLVPQIIIVVTVLQKPFA